MTKKEFKLYINTLKRALPCAINVNINDYSLKFQNYNIRLSKRIYSKSEPNVLVEIVRCRLDELFENNCQEGILIRIFDAIESILKNLESLRDDIKNKLEEMGVEVGDDD